jgi:hypothetical protein
MADSTPNQTSEDPPTQAQPCDQALKIPSPRLHFRSLAKALGHIRSNLAFVMHALQRWEDDEWPTVEDTVARELCSATTFLGGVLEGMAILEAGLSGAQPAAGMSFDARLRTAQDAAKALKSSGQEGGMYVDFWTLADFWRRYFPYQPRPSVFERDGGVKDISVALGDGSNSGPVMRGLLVPTFNHACSMMRIVAPRLRECFEVPDMPL